MNALIENIDKLHTTALGAARIKRNLSLETEDAVRWCRLKILAPSADIKRVGKNWYAAVDNCKITVNAHSYTIITAHLKAAERVPIKEETGCLLQFEDYIMAAPPKGQGHLVSALQFIEGQFPAAEQRLYHGLPTFFWGKKDLINIRAYKDHIGLHIGYALVAYLKEKHPAYRYTKSTIQFPYTAPFPFDLLQEICNEIRGSEIF